MILTETDIQKILIRYNGIGKELSSDERELLLFALYNESEARAGIAAQAKVKCDAIWRKQRVVDGNRGSAADDMEKAEGR